MNSNDSKGEKPTDDESTAAETTDWESIARGELSLRLGGLLHTHAVDGKIDRLSSTIYRGETVDAGDAWEVRNALANVDLELSEILEKLNVDSDPTVSRLAGARDTAATDLWFLAARANSGRLRWDDVATARENLERVVDDLEALEEELRGVDR